MRGLTMSRDLEPLPRRVQWWRRTADRRRSAGVTLKTIALTLLTLAISMLGATLISLGVYSVYHPAGLVVGGVLVWVLQWSHERDKENKR
jgi:Flp pilus assembly protein TadB